MKAIISLLLTLLCLGAVADNPPVHTTLSGTVTDEIDGEPLIGVTLYITEVNMTTITDINGHYHFSTLPNKSVTIQVSYVGHQTIIQTIDLSTTDHQDFVMKESNAMINEVVVTGLAGNQLIKESPTPVSTITLRELQNTAATNIIDAISRRPGISQITTGSGISKPVIRGLGYNRIVTVNDGVRQEGQQWGDEHGIEIDAQSVGSIEILKGPSSLMYGSDALAGVVIFHSRPTPPEGHLSGSGNAEYQTNNGLQAYSTYLGGNQKGMVWDMHLSGKFAHSYKNKADGRVPGTQFSEQSIGGMAGINRYWGFSHLKLSYYHLTPSLVEGERDETDGRLLIPALIEGEEEMVRPTHHQLMSYKHGFPYQQIGHFKATSDNSFYIGDGTLHAIFAYQHNQRQEFEELETPNDCGLDLRLHTLTYDLRYAWSGGNKWRLNTGIGGMWQQSVNKGEEYLTPDYHLFDIGAYVTAGYKTNGWNLSGGIRGDYRHTHARALEDRFSRFSRSFNALSGSIGLVRDLGSNMHLRINLARGFRAPNISELGSNGEHEGTFRYEVGNASLKPEHSWQADAGWEYSSGKLSARLDFFANLIDNYIYAHRLAGILSDGLPTYAFTQGNARLLGGEATIDIHPVERLHFENSFSYVDARQTHQSPDRRYLPRTPAPRWVSELSYDLIRDGRILNNTYVKIGVESYLAQNHVYSADNTETPTPSYTLLNLSAGTDIRRHHRDLLTLSIHIDNLTNRAYQNHLSRLKYTDINPVTGRQGIFNMGRNLIVKLSIPLLR